MQQTPTLPDVDRPVPPAAGPSSKDTVPPRANVGRVVAATILAGLLAATFLVLGPLAGAEEHVITGAILAAFACSWELLDITTGRWTDQPQTWARVPAIAMGAAAAALLLGTPTGNEAGWIWPPALLALVAWMAARSRRELHSRSRVFLLYPVFAVLTLAAVGGVHETYRELSDPTTDDMPGRLVSVGDHKLHISCSGSGAPTVVLEPGMGDVSTIMASRIAPAVAATTRVCVYDRAGRGWSESADGPQDGTAVATDLHTLLRNAGESGPYVLAGHSVGGIYSLNFARLFPSEVAGVALLDSMHPEQYERMASWPGFYEMYRRASALMPTFARLGVGRLMYGAAYADLPSPQREHERAFLSTPRHSRSVRDEFSRIRAAMDQAAELRTLGDRPLAVVTATRDADPDWLPMQEDLMTLSTNATQHVLGDATHAAVVEEPAAAQRASDAIIEVVTAARGGRLSGDGRRVDAFDELVRIDSGQLHLRCVGSGPTTVLLMAGWMQGDEKWDAIEAGVAGRARVCSYARFGTGTSDAPPGIQTFESQVADLHALLESAGEPGPYVVVGHSFGGAEAVTFASTYPDEVAGVMLIDASPSTWPATVCSVPAYAGGCAVMRDPMLDPERLDVFRAFDEVAKITSLGTLPMTIMTAAHRNPDGLTPDELTRLDREWAVGQQSWAALSTSSSVVTVDDTGHDIHVDQPRAVIDELLKLVP